MTPALLKEIKKKKSLYQKCMQIKANSPDNFNEQWEIYKKQKNYVTKLSKKLNELRLEDALINFKGVTPGMLVTLGEKKIKTLKDDTNDKVLFVFYTFDNTKSWSYGKFPKGWHWNRRRQHTSNWITHKKRRHFSYRCSTFL